MTGLSFRHHTHTAIHQMYIHEHLICCDIRENVKAIRADVIDDAPPRRIPKQSSTIDKCVTRPE